MGDLSTASESVHPAELLRKVEADGFAVFSSCLSEEAVQWLGSGLSDSSYGMRNLLAAPIVRELAASAPVRTVAEAVLGKNCFAVKDTFFNSTRLKSRIGKSLNPLISYCGIIRFNAICSPITSLGMGR